MRTIRMLCLSAGLLLAVRPGICAAGDREASSPTQNTAEISPETGVASYYADRYHGRKTANGEVFDTYKLTAAHGKLPFGTVVKVTNVGNNCSVIVRINDRGPFVPGRVIDLSRAAARLLRMEQAGLAKVQIEVLPATTSLSGL